MCGRLACSLCPEDIHQVCTLKKADGSNLKPKWKTDSGYSYKPFYNGPPTTTIPVLTYNINTTSNGIKEEYYLVPMKWGFTPPFEINPQALAHTHNARLENVTKSNLYRHSLTSNKRCIIVAEGFYEWQTKQGPDHKQPYFIYQDPHEFESKTLEGEKDPENGKYLMRMAGLWTLKENEEELKHSCTILTMESDSSLNWLHHRMPIILNSEEEIMTWLDPKNTTYEEALKIVSQPFNERASENFKLKYYTVDKKYVNKTSCNEKECLKKITVKRPNTLDSWLKPPSKKVKI